MGKHMGSAQSSAWYGASSQNNMSNFICYCIGFLGCFNKVPETEWLQTTEMHFLTILKARSPTSKCWQSHASSGDAEEESFAGFLRLLAIFGGFLACSCICPILPLHSHGLFTYICLPIYKYPSPYQDTSHGFGARPCLIQYSLILTNYICKGPISKLGYFPRF